MNFQESIELLISDMDEKKIRDTMNKVERAKATTIKWSKLPSDGFLPFKAILSGLKPDCLVDKISSKINAFEYHYDDESNLFLIKSYDRKGNVERQEYIDRNDNVSVVIDNYGSVRSKCKIAFDDKKRLAEGIYIDDCVRIHYSYNYEGDLISSIVVRSSQNGYIETTLFVERNGLEVVNLYYFFNEKKMYLIN
ncbi:hypothetical protein ABXV22_25475 [Vibrio rotiferianus]|uniref:hypothetical protein n=1 Tax=Vibrio rotiferianus TaxID=190895 RepID=UPI0033973558